MSFGTLRRLVPALALSLLSQAAALPGVAAAELRGIREGDALPSRSLKTPEGKDLALPGGEKGTVVVVFWSTWSPRSLPLLALWQEMAGEYSSHPLRVVAVNADHQVMDAERREAVKKYLADNGVTLPVAIDDGLALYNEIGVIALPTTLFFRADPAGAVLVRESPGFPSSARLDLREELETELGIAKKEEPAGHPRGQLAYQPANNALLYFGMGNALHKVGMPEKGHLRWAEALRRDGDYPDPLLALEQDFFAKGRTPESEAALHDFLAQENLPALAARYGKK
jgi:thiol-disulfide isomerase/thioredoxin